MTEPLNREGLGSFPQEAEIPTVPEDQSVVAVEYRVSLPWRKAGCEGWRVKEAEYRFLKGEYGSLEVRYSDGSTVRHSSTDDAERLERAEAALRLMRLAFGDPMTRRALGGHNERQQEAIFAASAALSKATIEDAVGTPEGVKPK